VKSLASTVLGLGLFATALAGCAKDINTGKAQKKIATIITSQTGARVKSVKCPGSVTAKKGDTFDCTVTGTDSSKGKVHVLQSDAKGHLHVSAPFLHVRDAEGQLAVAIGKQVGVAVKVRCPDVVVATKGTRFACSARSNDDKGTVHAVMTDDSGHFTYKLTQSG
jgi:hypothetical protein